MDTLSKFKRTLPLAALILSGCAIPQSALVYSSKVSVGLGISAAEPEQPGVSINIGYKQVDLAYVPVAVKGDPCTGDSSKNCGIIKIVGENKVDNGDNGDSEAIAELHQLSRLVKFAKSRLLAAERQKDDAKIATAKTALATAEKNLKDKLATTDPLIIRLAAASEENDKKDAYSVFGSFDAVVKADVPGASGTPAKVIANGTLNIGRIFSTGVAAQNLTEGIRDYYKVHGPTAKPIEEPK